MIDPKHFIDDFSAHSPFEVFYKSGIKPEDIKHCIIETLTPHFQNHDRLAEYAMTWLITGWVNFLKLQQSKWHIDNFEKVLQLFNNAKSRDKQRCLSIFVDWLPEINQSLSRFWSFKNMERNSSGELILDDYLQENMRLIGQLLEGIIKTYLKLLLELNRFVRGKINSTGETSNMDLGAVMDELVATTNFPDLFCPPPWHLKLNQWRNIAYHHNAKVEKERILCWYGKKPNINTIILTRSELLDVVKCIFNIYNIFKNVEFIFVFDNLPEYQKECKNKGIDFNLRDEAEILELFTGINSQGFKIIDFSKEENISKIVIEDLTDEDAKRRAIHSSQFLYQLWFYTHAANLCIEYRLKDGTPYIISKTNEEICRKIATHEEDIVYLAENVEFVFLRDDRVK
ncbi:MAG: hypothetical protein CVU55_12915 [Deltaproteobacteria bacterium HGW-Deltaproteobacteria-13]|jgi:hypothetical protein|nr:MAG: hypothetical protein CVU55_12915 [Deltaproteobacteria bacterium HGW-Deltaproteobacteria-13]